MKTSVCFVLIMSFVWLINPVSSRANSISVSQSIDKTEVAFEDIVNFEIVLTWEGPQTAYLFEKAISPDFDRFKVGNYSSTVSSTGTGENEITTKKLQYTLVPNLPGKSEIKPVIVEYIKWPDSIFGQLTTEAMTVTIAEQVKIVKPEESKTSVVTIVSIVVVVGLMMFLLWFFNMGKRKTKEQVKPPKELFLEKLNEIEKEYHNDLKQFQTKLYKLLFEYIISEYNLNKETKTSEQLYQEIENTDITVDKKEKYVAWLKRAEQEKFQPVSSTPGEVSRIANEIRNFLG